jgi:hypothetical protein
MKWFRCIRLCVLVVALPCFALEVWRLTSSALSACSCWLSLGLACILVMRVMYHHDGAAEEPVFIDTLLFGTAQEIDGSVSAHTRPLLRRHIMNCKNYIQPAI